MDQDVESHLEAASAAGKGLAHETGLLRGLLRAGWDAMSPVSRQAFLSDGSTLETHATGLAEDVSDVTPPTGLEALFEVARQHGEDSDEPDHEAGDLQDHLRNMARLMTPVEFGSFLESGAATDLVSLGTNPRP